MYKERVCAEELLVVMKKYNLDIAGVQEVGLSYEDRHAKGTSSVLKQQS
jgi:hypothetical protein